MRSRATLASCVGPSNGTRWNKRRVCSVAPTAEISSSSRPASSARCAIAPLAPSAATTVRTPRSNTPRRSSGPARASATSAIAAARRPASVTNGCAGAGMAYGVSPGSAAARGSTAAAAAAAGEWLCRASRGTRARLGSTERLPEAIHWGAVTRHPHPPLALELIEPCPSIDEQRQRGGVGRDDRRRGDAGLHRHPLRAGLQPPGKVRRPLDGEPEGAHRVRRQGVQHREVALHQHRQQPARRVLVELAAQPERHPQVPEMERQLRQALLDEPGDVARTIHVHPLRLNSVGQQAFHHLLELALGFVQVLHDLPLGLRRDLLLPPGALLGRQRRLHDPTTPSLQRLRVRLGAARDVGRQGLHVPGRAVGQSAPAWSIQPPQLCDETVDILSGVREALPHVPNLAHWHWPSFAWRSVAPSLSGRSWCMLHQRGQRADHPMVRALGEPHGQRRYAAGRATMAASDLHVAADEIRRAAARIGSYLRRTPTLELVGTRQRLPWRVALKLELLQVTGSFKPRGALNRMLELAPAERARGVVAASGGNHGLGVAYAAHVLGVPAFVYVPETASPVKVEKIRAWGAQVFQVGQFYHQAYQAAQERAEREGLAYVHAYADRAVVTGQGTVGLEFLDDCPDLEALLVAVGGGGLISGIAAYAGQSLGRPRVIGVEPKGIPTLYEALRAGRPVTLERIESIAADSLGAQSVAPINYELARRYVERVVLVSDEDIVAAQRFLWEEVRLVAEPGGAAALAALLAGTSGLPEGARVGVVVCGSNAAVRFE